LKVARDGIKIELTTKDDYLDCRFRGLSRSGHDLTPMNDIEKQQWFTDHQAYVKQDRQYSTFLGDNEKGIYVCALGGLPLFSSGLSLHKVIEL
jgi:hypothetical protein